MSCWQLWTGVQLTGTMCTVWSGRTASVQTRSRSCKRSAAQLLVRDLRRRSLPQPAGLMHAAVGGPGSHLKALWAFVGIVWPAPSSRCCQPVLAAL